VIVLAGDIGGTHVRLALAERRDGRARLLASAVVHGAERPDLATAVREFLRAQGAAPERACLGVAGTVEDDGARVSGVNLPWPVEARALEAGCGLARVTLINDFHAAARGVEQLGDGDAALLNPGRAVEGAPVAILGAGTGLGQAFLIGPAGRRAVLASEGGHRDFAPRDPLQDRLLAFLRARHEGRVSTERVLSGPGLLAIYEFLRADGRPADPEVERVWGTREAGRAITARGVERAHPTAAEAVAVFVDVYGAESGNLVLTLLTRGGVWIAGGIAPGILTVPAQALAFQRAYLDKGRFRSLLEQVPVRVVTQPALGLLGAAGEALAAG
jgi:glucokinase